MNRHLGKNNQKDQLRQSNFNTFGNLINKGIDQNQCFLENKAIITQVTKKKDNKIKFSLRL